MLSVRHFKERHKNIATSLSRQKQTFSRMRLNLLPQQTHGSQIPSSSLLNPNLDLDQSLLLAPPPIDYAQNMEAVRATFHQRIQSPIDTSTRHELIKVMQSALLACFQSMPVDHGVEEAQKTLDFITQHAPEHLINYPWIAEAPRAHELVIVIACELCTFFNQVAWTYFHVLFKNNIPQYKNILDNILISTLLFSFSHLNLALASIDQAGLDLTYSPMHPTLSDSDIEFSIQIVQNNIRQFYAHIAQYNLREERLIFALDHVLFMSCSVQAKLAIKQHNLEQATQLINQAEFFIQTYAQTKYYKQNQRTVNPTALIREIKQALKEQKNKASYDHHDELSVPSDDIAQFFPPTIEETTVTHEPESMTTMTPEHAHNEEVTSNVTLDDNQRLIGRKRLKTRKKETTEIHRLPTCYEKNPRLKTLLDRYSNVFIACGIDGYLFGSGHYKQKPGDFDILVPNICTKYGKRRLMQLIQMIESQGGVALRNEKTGELGYKKPNRYVIPLTWYEWKTDLIIETHDFIDHAKGLGETIGAFYFCLRSKKTYCIKGLSSLSDLQNQILRTIDEPYVRFKQDPSLLLRDIRLCALENFTFSPECLEAIQTLFFKEKNNIFLLLKYGKLCQQLNLIFKTPEETNILDQFQTLGLLTKLSQSIHALPSKFGNDYVIRLMQYKSCQKQDTRQHEARVSTLGMYSTTSSKCIKKPSSHQMTASISIEPRATK